MVGPRAQRRPFIPRGTALENVLTGEKCSTRRQGL